MIIVNKLVLVSLFFTFLLTNCGFQLNRNQIELNNGATSIHIKEVVNSSYYPSLDVKLKEALSSQFSLKKITLTSLKQADLVIKLNVTGLIISKSKYALDPNTNIQSYQFLFQMIGELKTINNKPANQNITIEVEKLIENKKINANYTIISQNQDLTDLELLSGKEEVVVVFSKNILNDMTNSF